MSQAGLRPPASSTSASSSHRSITRNRVWLQPAAAVLPVSSTKSENRSTVIRLTEYQFAAESPREWMSLAASSPGGTPSTTTKRLKLQRAASRSYKRPRLLSSAVSQAPREWICPTGGSSVCTREAKLEMTAVLMATALTTSRTIFSVRGADPTRLKKLFRWGVLVSKPILLQST